jgi:hypothetical protein
VLFSRIASPLAYWPWLHSQSAVRGYSGTWAHHRSSEPRLQCLLGVVSRQTLACSSWEMAGHQETGRRPAREAPVLPPKRLKVLSEDSAASGTGSRFMAGVKVGGDARPRPPPCRGCHPAAAQRSCRRIVTINLDRPPCRCLCPAAAFPLLPHGPACGARGSAKRGEASRR